MSTPRAPFFSSLASLLAGVLGLLQTRLELAGVELEDGIVALLAMLVMGAALVLFATLALLVASLIVVFAFDGSARLVAMGVLAFVYGAIAAAFGFKLRHSAAHRPPFLAATLAELARDRAALMKHAATEEEVLE